MTVEHIFKNTAPIVGVSSLIGSPESIGSQPNRIPTLAEAQRKLDSVLEQQRNCTSDYAYWGYEGSKAFWRMAVDVLKAAEITGPNNLPEVPLPDNTPTVVMDACSRLEKFGKEVLNKANG